MTWTKNKSTPSSEQITYRNCSRSCVGNGRACCWEIAQEKEEGFGTYLTQTKVSVPTNTGKWLASKHNANKNPVEHKGSSKVQHVTILGWPAQNSSTSAKTGCRSTRKFDFQPGNAAPKAKHWQCQTYKLESQNAQEHLLRVVRYLPHVLANSVKPRLIKT